MLSSPGLTRWCCLGPHTSPQGPVHMAARVSCSIAWWLAFASSPGHYGRGPVPWESPVKSAVSCSFTVGEPLHRNVASGGRVTGGHLGGWCHSSASLGLQGLTLIQPFRALLLGAIIVTVILMVVITGKGTSQSYFIQMEKGIGCLN